MVIFLNIGGLVKEINRIRIFKTVTPHQNIGHEFLGLKALLKNVPYIGYYSDGNLKEEKNNKDYSIAQYVLAPTILDPQNLSHEYILLVCSSEEIAWAKVQELKAEALLRNKFGMILARRPL